MKRVLTALIALTMVFSLAACGGTANSTASSGTASAAPSTGASSVAGSEVASTSMELRIGQTYYAAHGDKSFCVATVVTNGDTIVKTNIDEYQFLSAADATGVPNSDSDFGENFANADTLLASKILNDALYSKSMTEKGEATITLANNFKAVEDFANGKTITELKELIAKESAEVLDAVADCTLADAKGYLSAVVEAAEVAAKTAAVNVEAQAADITLGKVEYSSHGTRAFAIATAAMNGDTIVLSTLDEFQCMDVATTVGVPNSDGGFGENFVEGQQLVSKRVNDGVYSASMAELGEATLNIAASFDGVVAFANGKTIADAEALIKSVEDGTVEAADAIADCTLTDSYAYLAAIVAAAKAAK